VEREQVLDEIIRRIDAAGGTLVVPTKTLAAELGLKPQRMYNLIDGFERQGKIVTVSRGPMGTELRIGNGQPAARAAARIRSARRGGARASGGAASRTRRFCPWCGEAIADPRWAFCAHCGKELPR
jgi:hypothetical protein